jgi:hypothetical protein
MVRSPWIKNEHGIASDIIRLSTGVGRRAIEEGVATPTPSDEETEESEGDS